MRDWAVAERRSNRESVEGRIYTSLLQLIGLRKQTRVFAFNDTEVVDTANSHIFGYLRRHEGEEVLVLASFSEHEQVVPGEIVRHHGETHVDLVTGATVGSGDCHLTPYGFRWLTVTSL
jgi:amylosucrase